MVRLKLYLTSLEPDIDQTIYSQSIGGYCSNSLIYPETTLSSMIGLYDTNIILDTPSSGNWLEWTGEEYISINNEIIKVSPITGGTVGVVQRGYNDIINMHIRGDVVKAISSKQLFNNVFNDEYKQYRCIAVKNVVFESDPSEEDVPIYDFSIYLKQNSRNLKSSIRIGLEESIHQYMTGSSTSWNQTQIINTSLIVYPDDYFKGSYLKILGGEADGQGRIISDFNSSTGTITFSIPFSSTYDYDENVLYEIYPTPAQRIKTGTISPDLSSENTISFSKPDENSSIYFVYNRDTPSLVAINDLNPNDVVYIWIEREIEKGSEFFEANDIILNIKYKTRE